MEVDIYIHSTIKGPKQKDGVIAFVLEAELPDGRKATKSYFFQIEGFSKQRSWLKAVAIALEKVKEGNEAVISGNSAYLADGFMNLTKWKENGWKRSNGKEVKNADLWEQIFDLQKSRKARFLSNGDHIYSSWLPWEAEKRAKSKENVDFTLIGEEKKDV